MLLVIIMLNLLISIIGKSYENVTALERNNFNYERASSLFEVELTMDDDDKKMMKKYIFFGKNLIDELSPDELVECKLILN